MGEGVGMAGTLRMGEWGKIWWENMVGKYGGRDGDGDGNVYEYDVGRKEKSGGEVDVCDGSCGGVVDIEIDVKVGVGKNGAYKVDDPLDIDVV